MKTKQNIYVFSMYFIDFVFPNKMYCNTAFSIFIGNDILNQLTTYHNQKLKIVLSDFAGITKHADYTTFYVGNELFHYPLRIGGYSGDAGKCIFKLIRIGHTLITYT